MDYRLRDSGTSTGDSEEYGVRFSAYGFRILMCLPVGGGEVPLYSVYCPLFAYLMLCLMAFFYSTFNAEDIKR